MNKFLITTFAVVLLALGCRPTEDVVRLQLNWFPDAQHGGYFAAEVHDCFVEQGITNVEILSGGPGSPVIPKLLLGQVDFAVVNADQVLMARNQEKTDIVALFAPLQNSPRCIMVHRKSGIQSFADLRDVTLAMGEGKAFAEFLKSQVPLENVRIVPYSGTVAKFLLDVSFAQQGYVFTEPLIARRKGADPETLMVSDLGFNPYTSLLVTRRELIDRQPDRVEKFVNAIRGGWQQYLTDATSTNERILSVNPELDAEMLNEATQLVRDLCLPSGMSPELTGRMTADRWNQLARQLHELGLIDTDDADGAFLTAK